MTAPACFLIWPLVFVSFVCGSVLAEDAPPNVILITVDTLRADRLSSYGYKASTTPNIDVLAQEGVLFENAIVQTPITLPSHASIFTGTYPIFHGLQDVVGRLRGDVPTLAEWFKENGYSTTAFVGASVLMSHWGLDRGFDFYEDYFELQGLAEVDFSRSERPADQVVNLARGWVDENHSKPFFLWLHLYDPHDPYTPPEPYATQLKGRPYDGEIAFTDAMLGEFFRTLKKHGLYEDSLIVFTSDHGESLGEHEETYHGYFVYDASLRVPLIIRIPDGLNPGRFERGVRIANQVRSIDILPTIIQLLGHSVPAWSQGTSLVGLAAGRRSRQLLPAYAESHYPRIHFGWSPLFSISDGTHKFIEAPNPELYDLKKDPRELTNLYANQTARANQMREELHSLQRKYFAGTEVGDSGQQEVDPETMERLKSLGYVAFSAETGGTSSAMDLPDPKEKIGIYNQLNQAISLSREGKGDQVIPILKQVAELEPQMPIVHFLLGMEYFNGGLYLQAAEQLSETIRYNPGSNVARFNLARSYSRAGLSDRAKQAARELLDLDPKHFGARHLLALLFSKELRFDEAIAEELKAIEVRPRFSEAYNNLGSYYLSSKNTEKAIESYQKAAEYGPTNVLARENLALAYLTLKDYDAALKEAQNAVRLNPNSSLAYYYAGQAFLAKGMTARSRASFRKAKQLDPKLNVPTP
jgi:arylsulfatase A-like enzyme/Tfp pilus assembly protein PilF